MEKYESQVLVAPQEVPEPKKPTCSCGDCVQDYSDELKRYFKYLEEKQNYEINVKEGLLDDLKKAAEEDSVKQKKKAEVLAINHLIQVQKSTPFSSHDKGGKFGGASPYTDKDVAEAREYMQEVLGVEALSVNGRDLAHILAEVRAFAIKELLQENAQLKAKTDSILWYRKTADEQANIIHDFKSKMSELTLEMNNLREFQVAAQKVHKGEVAEVSTGRRIKE